MRVRSSNGFVAVLASALLLACVGEEFEGPASDAGAAAGASGAGGASGAAATGGNGGGGTSGSGGGTSCSAATCQAQAGPCRVGKCVAGGCEITTAANGTPCDDGLYCTTPDQCQDGACSGEPRICVQQGTDPCVSWSCDESIDGCVATNEPDGTACDDGNACTLDACKLGACKGVLDNLAKYATAKSSGGGVDTQGPAKMIDGTCANHWISNTSTSVGWIELDWPSAVQIGSILIDVDDPAKQRCFTGSSRYIASGKLQYWDGMAWLDATPFTANGDVQISLSSTLTTTKILLTNLKSGTTSNSIIHELYVFTAHDCALAAG